MLHLLRSSEQREVFLDVVVDYDEHIRRAGAVLRGHEREGDAP